MNIHDAAVYILEKQGDMSAMKLQKLCYYSQAWSLVWDDRAMFDEDFQAWANGPVCQQLYESHRGCFRVSAGMFKGDSAELDQDAEETIDTVLKHYGSKSAQWLSDLTHREDPWLNAREGLADNVRSDRVITKGSMAEYYSGL